MLLHAKEIEIAANSQDLLHRINEFVGPNYELNRRFNLSWDLYNGHEISEDTKLKLNL